MRSIDHWVHLMSSQVGIADRTGVDGYSAPTYGSVNSYRAHLSQRRKVVRNMAGQEIVSQQALYLDGNPNILPTAQVTLSTDDAGSTENWALHPPIIAIERRNDQYGPHHTVVFLGG